MSLNTNPKVKYVGDENCAYVLAKEYCAYFYIIDQKHTYHT